MNIVDLLKASLPTGRVFQDDDSDGSHTFNTATINNPVVGDLLKYVPNYITMGTPYNMNGDIQYFPKRAYISPRTPPPNNSRVLLKNTPEVKTPQGTWQMYGDSQGNRWWENEQGQKMPASPLPKHQAPQFDQPVIPNGPFNRPAQLAPVQGPAGLQQATYPVLQG